MDCPTCDRPMTDGQIRLRAQWIARVVFTPAGMEDGFRQRDLAGTLFNSGRRPGEADVVSNYSNSTQREPRSASRCLGCGALVVQLSLPLDDRPAKPIGS